MSKPVAPTKTVVLPPVRRKTMDEHRRDFKQIIATKASQIQTRMRSESRIIAVEHRPQDTHMDYLASLSAVLSKLATWGRPTQKVIVRTLKFVPKPSLRHRLSNLLKLSEAA